MAINVRCRCGATVTVPKAGIYVPCPSCELLITAPATQNAPRPTLIIETVPIEPEPPPSQKACPRCGAPMLTSDRVCLACGHGTVGSFPPVIETPQKTAGPAKLAVLIGLAVLLLGGAIVGIALTKVKPSPPVSPGKGYFHTVLTAPRHVRQVLNIASAQQSIQAFAATEGRYPKSLDELAQHGTPAPEPPPGYEYDYNPDTGQISLNPVEPPPATKEKAPAAPVTPVAPESPPVGD